MLRGVLGEESENTMKTTTFPEDVWMPIYWICPRHLIPIAGNAESARIQCLSTKQKTPAAFRWRFGHQ